MVRDFLLKNMSDYIAMFIHGGSIDLFDIFLMSTSVI
jgi:hypothetical protein